ncbi:hypothetical protein BURMUCGD2M_6263 [Burkholderia multivorans CGD2M]|nr:hypothetical protein BURMUCGD2M_6263 [Burkholderia multivorans CGD2M]
MRAARRPRAPDAARARGVPARGEPARRLHPRGIEPSRHRVGATSGDTR